MYATHREQLARLRMFREQEVPERPAWMLNQIFFMWGHKWIYDFEEVRHVAELAGWDPEQVQQCAFSEGSDRRGGVSRPADAPPREPVCGAACVSGSGSSESLR